MKRYCLALDLKDDPDLIDKYEAYHKAVWPQIIASIEGAGITNMEIYRTGNRLFMILEAGADFSFEKKEISDRQNPKVAEWENLMSACQQQLPHAEEGEKWKLMEKIFQLKEN
jgi:L-rhamnose mutarotase